MKGVAARYAAARAVADVLADGHPLEGALSGQEDYHTLAPRDRAFARLIAATTFRRLGQINAVLKPYVKKDPPGYVRACLQTATAQILFLGTPAHAAVGETVNLLKSRPQTRGFSGMANAVLRRVVENGPKAAAIIAPQENIPPWLRRSWEKTYGPSAMRKMALQLLKDPPLDLTVKSGPDAWAETLGGDVMPSGTVRLSKIGDVSALEGYAAGQWWAQDIAASLPVKVLGDIKGLRVLDLCAAPGGKTMQLAQAGAHVTAVDRSQDRLERVRQNLDRTGLEATLICADGRDFDAEPFDIVLLDAPCSATGTYRRHPDVLHNKQPKDVAQLGKIQRALLKNAARLTKSGGTLLYCTCTLQPEESEQQISRFLSELPDFRLNPVLTLPGLDMAISLTAEGCLRTCPHFLDEKGGVDGFFIARMGRKKLDM